MYESDTYLAILEEGARKHARKVVLRLGQKKFGPAGDDVVAAVNSIEDLEQLGRLVEGYDEASSWRELFQSVEPPSEADPAPVILRSQNRKGST